MRVELWNPNRFDQDFENIATSRLLEAAEIVKDKAKSKCPVGTISRPMYKTGPYANQPYTARDVGSLKKSIRIVRKKTKSGKAFSKKKNVRVYAGNFIVYYASIVEHYTPFLRPAFTMSLSQIRQLIGAR